MSHPRWLYRVGAVSFAAAALAACSSSTENADSTASSESTSSAPIAEPLVATYDGGLYILDGEMTFTFGATSVPAPPGTFVLVPPGVEHGFRNDGAQPVRMLNIHAPAGFDRRIGLS